MVEKKGVMDDTHTYDGKKVGLFDENLLRPQNILKLVS